ncbi:hypothetical protein BaRGS_00039711 [Batillaria attramentaria]|uniref:Aquaporin n=1 Tax=Batillaria attramentaria TaxID=370345 RepID=A0ABD0J2D3_9CAEN
MSIHSLNTYTPRATAEPPSTARLVCRQLMDLELEDLRSGAFWKAVVAEFIGCFFLVYFGVGAGLCGPDEPPPSLVEVTLSAGFFIAAILTALTAVSGAHVNPAVSLGFLVARQCSFVRFVFYVIAQSAGSITGAALLRAVTPESKIGNLGLLLPPPDVTTEQALMAEFMITFLLLFCIIAMVDSGRSDVKGSVPFIVGLVVCVNIFYATVVPLGGPSLPLSKTVVSLDYTGDSTAASQTDERIRLCQSWSRVMHGLSSHDYLYGRTSPWGERCVPLLYARQIYYFTGLACDLGLCRG